MHGDLHPGNVLAENRVLSGVIDWGDLNAGDEATDVACCWMLLDDPDQRDRFVESYVPDDALFTRAAGWAVNFATALAAIRHPELALAGRATLRRLREDLRRGFV